MTSRKKLIEVAVPLEAINIACAREKTIRHGHPSSLHLWWARRPLAAARAVIFAQMVDDPSSLPDLFPTEKAQQKERERLFAIIRDLVLWENTTNEAVLQRARNEIWQSWRRACADNVDHPRAGGLFDRHKLPAFHDPFAGGGALPLEAQRLGLEAYASDLNPVAVLINKAMLEVPPRFSRRPPVNPKTRADRTLLAREWPGASGLAEDLQYYGDWMRHEAEKRIGHLYPEIEVTPEMGSDRPDLKPLFGQKLTVISWLWTRTVKSPNPAFGHVDVPLASNFILATRDGKEVYVQPVIEGDEYRFTVRLGKSAGSRNGTKSAGSHSPFLCLMSGTPIPFEYIRAESKAGRLGMRLMAVVAEGDRGRVFLPPSQVSELVAAAAKPEWKPDVEICHWPGRTNVVEYGMTSFGDLFTARQLVALTTLADLVSEARTQVARDAAAAGMLDDGKLLNSGGEAATAYADAIALYLAFLVSKLSDLNNNLVAWKPDAQCPVHLFARQAIPMVWDFAEANPLSDSSGSWRSMITNLQRGLATFTGVSIGAGAASEADASEQSITADKVVSTDPPYYDNIGYADLSDFFYVWLRRSLRPVFPDLFVRLAVPKTEELVATPYGHGAKEDAEAFFLAGMTKAMHRLAELAHPAFPVTIYYAFKQLESKSDAGLASTGWETFLAAVIRAGFALTGTWPVRTEMGARQIAADSNALASSIILVCRPRAADAPTATRREFIAALKSELPGAVANLQRGNIAPVDLAQAAIGPGMGVYTRYAQVLGAEGKPLSVREALALINQTLDDALVEQEGDFDADSRWALAWFEQSGFTEGDFGVAETLSKAKVTSVQGLKDAGLLDKKSPGGKVRLLKPGELPADWDPLTDKRLTDWEIVHHLIRVLDAGGEAAAAELVAKLGSRAETARELCYRLFTLCERKKRAADALSYNALVQSWPEIVRIARDPATAAPVQQVAFGE